MSTLEKIVIMIVITVPLAFVGFFVLIITALMGHSSFYVPYIVVIFSMILFFVANKLFNFITKGMTKKLQLLFLALLLVAVGIYEGINFYERSLATLDDQEVDMSLYRPFDNDGRLVTLDNKASLQIEADLPVLDGATALYPLYAAFAQETYPEKSYSIEESEVIVSKTPYAYKNLISGNVDIIFAAGPSDRQVEAAETKGLKFDMTPIGREAFVFFVNASNPVDELTTEQIQSIYAGEITNWSEVGGKNQDIQAFQRPDDSGSQTTLEKFMGNKSLMKAPTDDIVTGMGGIISETANYTNYRNAIGYSFRYFSMDLIQNNEIKHLAIDGVYPDKKTIRTGEYPISKEFYAITTDTDNPNVDRLIEWILSDQGQKLVEETGYVPVGN
ncbi:hypothetical protein GCM10011351_05090 [Paraliobacillus quinghaiensis]|uniref:PBP domain-containing protein n=1 Tax=Paraliobacillus quinghaiensis TaxID=470815 RepID=A0A917TGC4_9BACI|nr:substrate-binding domain-containing protein [Paraliobacillus quinghaiensis]GGM22178.1 hypothetical protein GCM10011351_05090 [Paraliobacillus quinghaiensis]